MSPLEIEVLKKEVLTFAEDTSYAVIFLQKRQTAFGVCFQVTLSGDDSRKSYAYHINTIREVT
jgi:hypothetical protein